MIGFYNYTVILTYMSLVSSIIGMTLAHAGKFGAAVFCLALSGFFDMFDGKVARRKTDRTDDEKLFGIQLDSLCDVVAFGAFPAFLCYCMGVTGRIGFLAIAFYSVSGVIRLAYFNVLETNHFFSEEEEYEKSVLWAADYLHRDYFADSVRHPHVCGDTDLQSCSDNYAVYGRHAVHREFQAA